MEISYCIVNEAVSKELPFISVSVPALIVKEPAVGAELPDKRSALIIMISPAARLPVVKSPSVSVACAVAVAGVYFLLRIPLSALPVVISTPSNEAPVASARNTTPAGSVTVVSIALTLVAPAPCKATVSFMA